MRLTDVIQTSYPLKKAAFTQDFLWLSTIFSTEVSCDIPYSYPSCFIKRLYQALKINGYIAKIPSELWRQ